MCYNSNMKIIFPELSSNPIATEATNEFKDIEFVSADSLDQATTMLKNGEADSMISGLDHSSRDVLLTYKDHIPLKSPYFSSCFICQKQGQVFALADGGVNKIPTQEQLLTIIEDTATTFQTYTNIKPKIALLSYSTHGSGGKNPDLIKYQFCLDQIKSNHPDWLIDGELQLDAALVEEVGQLKAPGSPVAGHANTLVFPSLEAGNIGYKLVQRLAKAPAYGPVLQGLALPVNDLSRGCNADDIVGTVAITAVQAQAQG